MHFDTIHKISTFQSNYTHVRIDRIGLVFMVIDRTSSRVSNSATNLVWFSRFMQGSHKRMGEINLPDKAVDQYIIQGCFEVAQCIWEKNQFDIYARQQAAMAIFIVISEYYGGL